MIGLRSAMVKSAAPGNNPYAGTLYEDAQPWERPDYNPEAALQEEARRSAEKAIQTGANWSQGIGQQYQGPAQGVAGRVGEFAGTAYNSYLKPVGQAVAGAGKQLVSDAADRAKNVLSGGGIGTLPQATKAHADNLQNRQQNFNNIADAVLKPITDPKHGFISKVKGSSAASDAASGRFNPFGIGGRLFGSLSGPGSNR